MLSIISNRPRRHRRQQWILIFATGSGNGLGFIAEVRGYVAS